MRPSRWTVSVVVWPCSGCQVALQPGIAATERTTRTPCGEDTVAAVGSSGAPFTFFIDAPEAERPGSAWMLSGPVAKWSVKTANEPSKPANPHRGGTRALCSWPSATNTCPPGSAMDGAPSRAGAPCAQPTTAMLATGRERLIATVDAVTALARNQRVEPPGVVSPICIPAAASSCASGSGTSTLDTSSGVPRYQVARWPAARSCRPVPVSPGAGPPSPAAVIRYAGRVRRTEVSSWSRVPFPTAAGESTSCPSPEARCAPVPAA